MIFFLLISLYLELVGIYLLLFLFFKCLFLTVRRVVENFFFYLLPHFNPHFNFSNAKLNFPNLNMHILSPDYRHLMFWRY
jgi:hypothetical protein